VVAFRRFGGPKSRVITEVGRDFAKEGCWEHGLVSTVRQHETSKGLRIR
jgi:hypothetical protein